ncbi:4'-phosphopantetheinyl transferase family protein [Leifsonia sp. NPDC058248]|uniref:4'-phosphopantetheinyl transferase family protein n=1 Tax=Leifsonia sp. NPDC058248 TaxID=3346402 RepID=UPI0036D85E6F
MDPARGLTVRLASATHSGRPLLRELVAELAGVDAGSVRIEARCPDCGGPHGRPVVMAPDAARRIHVSLSHVGGTVVAVASADRTVGVDAEPADALADRSRAAGIRNALGRTDGDPLLLWTAVEAVLKADGRGLRVDPRTVSLGPGRDGALFEAVVPGDPRHYGVREVDLGSGLRVSVAREL